MRSPGYLIFTEKPTSLIQHSGYISSSDESRLFWQSWAPDHRPAASVYIVHGLADHSSRFGHVAEKFADAGILSFAIDLRGHGKSEGMRTYVNTFRAYVADMEAGWAEMQRLLDGNQVPVFLFGHSMGSLVCIHFINQHNPAVRGWITTAALVEVNRDLSPILVKMSGLLSALLPRVKTVRLDIQHLSSDPSAIRQAQEDPLYYKGRLPARTGKEILDAASQAEEVIKSIDHPLLAMHGGEDKITMKSSSIRLVGSVPAADKELVIYPGAYHELVNESNKDEVIRQISDWILARI